MMRINSFIAILLLSTTARAEDPPSVDELFDAPAEEEEEAATEEEEEAAPAPIEEAAPAEEEAPPPVEEAPPPPPPAPVVKQEVVKPRGTIAERGGLFGLGLVVAPKVGAGMGNLFFEGLGTDLTLELEVGYALPLKLPAGRDLQAFAALSYAGPSTTQTITADDPRFPGGAFSYNLTLHQLSVFWGALYRIPLNIEWLRPYVGLGARSVWNWTVVDGEAGGAPFGQYTESGVNFGAGLRVGGDFYVGPGAILAELQLETMAVNQFILRQTNPTSINLALGYRFYL